MSSYSPFFTSGLLASTSSRSPRSCHHHHRRGSLPESSTTATSSRNTRATSAYYLSLQRRDQNEYRSFLSLDLAESRLSQRHGPQSIPPVPALPPLALPVVSPLRSHFSSTSSLRSVASPKPAPNIMLPKIPDPPPPYSKHKQYKRLPPILPELPVLPALQFPLPPNYVLQSKVRPHPHPQRPLPSPPVPHSPSPDLTTDSKTTFSPPTDSSPAPLSPASRDDLRSSVLTKPKHLRSKKPKNFGIITNPAENRLSRASVSTVSTRVRRRNRWDALDALEGRRKPGPPSSPFVPPLPREKKKKFKMDDVFVKPTTFVRPQPNPIPKHNPTEPISGTPNFMNMSDDSDPEPESAFGSSSAYSTVSDYDSDHLLSSNPLQNLSLHPNATLDSSRNPLLEPEDIVLPSTTAPPSPRPGVSNTQSYLDVDKDDSVVLEATRALSPQVTTPTPLVQPSQRVWMSRVKGPVERPPKPKPAPGFAAVPSTTPGKTSTSASKEKHKTKSTRPSTSKHLHSSSSKKHNTPAATSRPNAQANVRNNHTHYKSFIELDMDDLLDQEDW